MKKKMTARQRKALVIGLSNKLRAARTTRQKQLCWAHCTEGPGDTWGHWHVVRPGVGDEPEYMRLYTRTVVTPGEVTPAERRGLRAAVRHLG